MCVTYFAECHSVEDCVKYKFAATTSRKESTADAEKRRQEDLVDRERNEKKRRTARPADVFNAKAYRFLMVAKVIRWLDVNELPATKGNIRCLIKQLFARDCEGYSDKQFGNCINHWTNPACYQADLFGPALWKMELIEKKRKHVLYWPIVDVVFEDVEYPTWATLSTAWSNVEADVEYPTWAILSTAWSNVEAATGIAAPPLPRTSAGAGSSSDALPLADATNLRQITMGDFIAPPSLEPAPLAAHGDALANRTNRVGSAAAKRKHIAPDSDSDDGFSSACAAVSEGSESDLHFVGKRPMLQPKLSFLEPVSASRSNRGAGASASRASKKTCAQTHCAAASGDSQSDIDLPSCSDESDSASVSDSDSQA